MRAQQAAADQALQYGTFTVTDGDSRHWLT